MCHYLLCNHLFYHGILNKEEGVQMKDFTIRFKDCSIYYEMHENKTKPTLAFLHGYTSDLTIFETVTVTFKKDYQLLLIDLPGHGRSGVSKSVSIKDMPEIIKSIFDYQDIPSAYFIGIDLGSLSAQAFGHLYPNQLQSLVSIGSYSIYHDSFNKINREHRWTRFGLALRFLFNFKGYLSHFAKEAAISDSGIHKFEVSQKLFKKKGIQTFKGIHRFMNFGQPIKAYPIYVVCGEFEEEVIKDASLQFEQKVPNAILEGFNKSKHVVFLDQPRIFIEHVQTFFKTHA